MTSPALRVEVAFAADPLDATYAKAVCNGSANSSFTTPDAASLDITGDLEVVARCAPADWTPSTERTVAAKWMASGNQRSWRLAIRTTGVLRLSHSANGSATIDTDSTAAPVATNGSALWVKATLDVDDGASGHAVRFYTAPDSEVEPLAWTQLGSTVTTAGTTSLFASTSALEVGSRDAAGSAVFDGNIERVIVRNGIAGTVVADFDPSDALTASSTSWGSTRVAGQVWSAGTAASLSIAPAWTDISAYVKDEGVSISRGKQSEIPTYATSSLSLTLNNRDRRFDPEYASSPLYPNVKPRKRIRLRATWASTTHTLWTGYVESWPQAYPAANFDAEVPLTAYDILGLLNDGVLDDTGWAYVDSLAPAASLRIVANDGWLDEVSGGQVRRRKGILQTSDGIASGPSTGIVFDGATYWSVRSPNSYGLAWNTVDTATYSCWFTCSTLHPTLTSTMFGATAPNTSTADQIMLQVGITAAGKVLVAWQNAGGTNYSAYTTSTYADGLPHQVTIVHNSTRVFIYVDGVDVTDIDSGPTGGFDAGRGVNLFGYLPNTTVNAYFTGTLSDFYAWTTALTAAQVAELYRLTRGSVVESTGERAARLLELAGVPDGLQAVTDIGKGVVADLSTAGQSALGALQTVADSESGSARLFADTRGRVTLHDRFWWQSSPRGSTTQATFSDDLSDLYFFGVSADRNLRDVQNVVQVTGSEGVSATATDATSVADYGTRSASVPTLLSTQGQADSLAAGLVALRKDPVTRLDAITVRPAFQTSAWPQVLRLDLGDRIVFEIMPARGVASTSQLVRTLIVERLQWTITASEWQVAVTGSPIPTITVFTLDSSLLDGTDVLGF